MSEAVSSNTEHDWEEQARDWVAWTRRPDHDSYWRYRDDFFGLVPEPGKATLIAAAEEADPGRFLDDRPGAPFVLDGAYFDSRLDIPYHLWLRVLSPAW